MLPYSDSPYTQMYHNEAFSLGIIQANAQTDITPWLCGKFVNCFFSPIYNNQFKILWHDNWAEEDGILTNQRINLLIETFQQFPYGYLDLLKRMIDLGGYPHGDYNEEYIPGKAAYQLKHHQHDFLLFGYDDEKQLFSSAGYLKDGRFQKFFIPYENMVKSISTLKRDRVALNFWKYNQDADFSLRPAAVIEHLRAYLRSEATPKTFKKDSYFGFEAIEQLAHYYRKTALEKGFVDIRYTRGLMEHKFFMQKRIEYFSLKGYLTNDKSFLIAEDVYQTSQTIHFLALKYLMTRRQSSLDLALEKILETVEKEKEYLPQVLVDLESRFG